MSDTSFPFGANEKKYERKADDKIRDRIVHEKLLSEKQTVVYAALFESGPMTSGELTNKLGPGLHKRLSELERLGVARRVGHRKCAAGGRNAYAWDVTGQLPKEPDGTGPVKVRQALAVGEDPWHAAASFARKLGYLPDRAGEYTNKNGDWVLEVQMADGEVLKASGILLPGGALVTKWE